MRVAVTAMSIPLMLGACTQTARDELTRDAARAAITPVVVERFPGLPVDSTLDCIIDNAQSSELLALAADTVTGPTASTVEIVSNIATRPETVRCLAVDGLPALLR